MNNSPKKILVTGVAGFLGSHLAEKLAEMKHKVIGVDNMMGGYEDNGPKNIEFLPWNRIKFPYFSLGELIKSIIFPFLSKSKLLLPKKIPTGLFSFIKIVKESL